MSSASRASPCASRCSPSFQIVGLVELLGFFACEFFISADDEINEYRLAFDQVRGAIELFAGDKQASRASKEVEHDVPRLCATAESFLVEHGRFFRRVFVVASAQAFHKPDIQHVENVLDRTVACPDFFVEQLGQVEHLVREIGASDRPVYAGFVLLVECDLWRRCAVVLDPEADTLRHNTKLDVEHLEKPDVPLVAIGEDVDGLVADRNAVRECLVKECAIFIVRLRIIHRTAVTAFATDALVVVERDVIRRIGIDGLGFLAVHEFLNDFCIRAVATD